MQKRTTGRGSLYVAGSACENGRQLMCSNFAQVRHGFRQQSTRCNVPELPIDCSFWQLCSRFPPASAPSSAAHRQASRFGTATALVDPQISDPGSICAISQPAVASITPPHRPVAGPQAPPCISPSENNASHFPGQPVPHPGYTQSRRRRRRLLYTPFTYAIYLYPSSLQQRGPSVREPRTQSSSRSKTLPSRAAGRARAHPK